MLKIIDLFQNSSYVKQITTLMSGTLIAQIIMLGSMPLLTRLYDPSEFGIYALFISVITIFGNVSSLKYDQAIMLPKNDKDATALLFLSFIITFFFSLLSLILILIFQNFILNYFANNQFLIYLLPLGIFITGIVQIFTAYASRNQRYKEMTKVRVYNAFNLSWVQIASKYIGKFDGLILGRLIADFISVIYFMIYFFKKNMIVLSHISKRRVQFNIDKHHHFPKYQSITVFLNAVSQNIPILLLGYLYSSEIAGYYALTMRALQAPVGLIGNSTREVFYQRASKLYANKESFFNLYYKTTITLLKLFIIPMFVIFLYGEEIYSFVFGANWAESGMYSEILIFWVLYAFINSPTIASFSILNLQKIQLYVEVLSVALRFCSIYVGFYFFNSVSKSILLFTIASIFVNSFLIIYIYLKIKKSVLHVSR